MVAYQSCTYTIQYTLAYPCILSSISLHTSVARCGLNDGVALLQQSTALSILNHLQPNAVLNGTTSVEELTLGHYKSAGEREGEGEGEGESSEGTPTVLIGSY